MLCKACYFLTLVCCASCSMLCRCFDSTSACVCMVLLLSCLLLERCVCHFKVVDSLKDNVFRKGKAMTLDNICSTVLCKSDVATTFNLILKRSWGHRHLPCLLLSAQVLCFVCLLIGSSGMSVSAFDKFALVNLLAW